MALSFTDEEIHAQAVRLGLVQDGQDLPRSLRSRVVASLAAERQRPATSADAPVAQSIVIQPGGDIQVDGRPFPWVVQADQMEVTLAPDGAGMVRLTLPALNVQILKPATPESENRA
ncbi:hypothetical protein ACH49_24360 [Streptomyces leeuwenhoekii]|uniref:Uncharacterized protein n=1 Tax=Streptomyces leeuwenhoekii TaxID=1437453 RepID=A0ABR5HT58_STRLW|nr:hypothetical protein [Streptomyces leeuwenhoekii]KMS71761.1 hypothetical protein ACH49_24360 [Streptomyces leeuwenhoekii]